MKSLRILPICLAAIALPLAFTGCNKGSDMSAPSTADTNAAAPAPADTNMAPAATDAAPMAPAPATDTNAPAAMDTNAPATNAAPSGT